MLKLNGTEKENRQRIINILSNLENRIQKEDNNKANTIEWYGKRLILLRNFYGRERRDILSYLVNVKNFKGTMPIYRVTQWELNEVKPPPLIINHLADMFNVSPEFFTERVAHLNIVEQIRLTEI